MRVIETVSELRAIVSDWHLNRQTVGLVPTMGALHAGHVSLMDAARAECDRVVVSIFINPTQFGPNEDFSRYPRTFEDDHSRCLEAGVDLIFMPSAETMYPTGFGTTVDVGPISEILEGEFRPGHYQGVATVVLKFFALVQPNVAYFGAKDYQQQLVIRRMVIDLNLPVEIRTCPTLREPDGIAMSSRNRYLEPEQRERALAISRVLQSARETVLAEKCNVPELESRMAQELVAAGFDVDYAVIRNPDTLEKLQHVDHRQVLLIAARLGDVRLIDQLEVTVEPAPKPDNYH